MDEYIRTSDRLPVLIISVQHSWRRTVSWNFLTQSGLFTFNWPDKVAVVTKDSITLTNYDKLLIWPTSSAVSIHRWNKVVVVKSKFVSDLINKGEFQVIYKNRKIFEQKVEHSLSLDRCD